MEKTPQTIGEWHALLERAVSDKVVPSLDRVGGIEQFVKAVTRGAEDISGAIVMRDVALDDLISRVTLTATEPRRTLHYLDLTGAFKPKSGFMPVADFLRRHLRISVLLREGVFVSDLRLRALQVLEAYYPTPPLYEISAYAMYLDLLKQFTALTAYSGYALARLLELHKVTLRDPIAKLAVRTADAEALGDLVQRVLAFNLDDVASEKLGEIYNLAVGTNQLQLFREAVERNDGKFRAWVNEPETMTEPEIRIGGRSVALFLSAESQAHAIESLDFGAAIREFMSGEHEDEHQA
jgi:hypothetical protein